MKSLKNRRALVIGGTGGIGAATATLLAEAGAEVAITWRRGGLNDVEARARRAALDAGSHFAIEADVADSPSLERLRDVLTARWGSLDIVVHAAGFTTPIPAQNLDALTDELIDSIFQVNWRGQFASMRALAPLLKASGDGLAVFISSIAAVNGAGSNIAYGAAKAGIETLVKSLARALAPEIRVMGVSPGVVATDFVPGRDAAFNARIGASLPLRRVATADDVADAILACATHLGYATGTTIVVDGGRLL